MLLSQRRTGGLKEAAQKVCNNTFAQKVSVLRKIWLLFCNCLEAEFITCHKVAAKCIVIRCRIGNNIQPVQNIVHMEKEFMILFR